jgi:Tol biopolymer transport system component
VPASTQFRGFIVGAATSFSPDGKTLAYTVDQVDAQAQEPTEKIALLDVETMAAPRLLPANPLISGGVAFTHDGRAVVYPIRDKGIDNLWLQPLDGSPGRRLTRFTSDQIDQFSFSPDGRSIALLRGHAESDVVLLQQSKP